MNLVAAIKTYVTKMIEDSGPGMKVLLMDKHTTSIVSMVYSQSEILQKEVFLFERLDAGCQESVHHLKCIVFVRPTPDNICSLCAELKYPRYNSYYIYLSNITSMADIKALAEADEQEVVREVQEFYGDYLAASPHFFSLGLPLVLKGVSYNGQSLQRCVQGVVSVLLSLKKSPAVRYRGGSEIARRLAEGIRDILTKESGLCSFGSAEGTQPVLLILDRRDDPVTPLLNQWTYQAMVHELLGITNNRVCLPDNQGMKEVVLSAEQDEFYANNLYLNFGEIGLMIKELMDVFQAKVKSNQKVKTIQDMKNFVETYPMFKKMSGTVAKHVNVVGEMSSMTERYSLMEISELEQEIVSQDDHSQQLQRIRKLIGNSKVRDIDATRLVMLYCLRYERHPNNDITGLVDALKKRGTPDRYVANISSILDYNQQSDLFGDNKIKEKIRKRFFMDLKGVENVFTRHSPILKDILDDLSKGRLREQAYPCINGSTAQVNKRIQDIIVFIIGGATYEESAVVHQMNLSNPGLRIILGGSTIHNTESFIDEVETATDGVPRRSHHRTNLNQRSAFS